MSDDLPFRDFVAENDMLWKEFKHICLKLFLSSVVLALFMTVSSLLYRLYEWLYPNGGNHLVEFLLYIKEAAFAAVLFSSLIFLLYLNLRNIMYIYNRLVKRNKREKMKGNMA